MFVCYFILIGQLPTLAYLLNHFQNHLFRACMCDKCIRCHSDGLCENLRKFFFLLLLLLSLMVLPLDWRTVPIHSTHSHSTDCSQTVAYGHDCFGFFTNGFRQRDRVHHLNKWVSWFFFAGNKPKLRSAFQNLQNFQISKLK